MLNRVLKPVARTATRQSQLAKRWMSSDIKLTPCGLHIDRSLPRNFDKILIANRGEIAVRVIRTAKELGVKTVAVYSDADADSLHVQMADEAVHIGPPTAAESYLRADRILEVCRQTGAQAVHPGYGFMSENAQFAQDCADAGVTFIGPPASAIVDMGSKSASKRIMIDANVPVVPGYHGEDQSIETLRAEADKCGFPLMIKAVLGGGGKGMRIVLTKEDFDEMLDACKRESMKSFKDDRVLIERYIQRPRHIEFQVFADTQGNAVHLYERDCSVQRRHQKVLEEAPAPGMTPELRKQMGDSAVNAAKAVGYVGAGTVEFIFDAETDEYFFMEMNTRLQVEHPVTEMVMQKDLVQWQLHVAAGNPLPAKQEELSAVGHALEARIYAENPNNNFLPATGTLTSLRTPEIREDCRVETGVRQDDEVSIFYDPMIAKLIVTGNNRDAALRRMSDALAEYQIVGPPTNIEFLKKAVNHPAFQKGKVETGFIDEHIDILIPPVPDTVPEDVASMACLSLLLSEAEALDQTSPAEDEFSPWSQADNLRLNLPNSRSVSINFPEDNKVAFTAEIEHLDSGYKITYGNGEVVEVDGEFTNFEDGQITARMLGQTFKARVVQDGANLHIFMSGTHTQLAVPTVDYSGSSGSAGGSVAPMAGKVVKVSVKAGDSVTEGTPLVIMEAMKMEHVIKASKDGVVESVLFQEGDFVDGGKVLVTMESTDE